MSYTSRVSSVEFSLADSEKINATSALTVKNHYLFQDNKPFENGIYDAHLGTTDHSYKCATCGHSKSSCVGHAGSFELKYPLITPIAIMEVKRWLKVICLSCGKLPSPLVVYENIPIETRFNECSKMTKIKNCIWCNSIQLNIKSEKEEKAIIFAELLEDKKLIRRDPLFPHIIKVIFDKVSDEVVNFMGKAVHPKSFIVSSIRITSTALRPDTKKNEQSADGAIRLTKMIQSIIRREDTIPQGVQVTEADKDIVAKLNEITKLYNEMHLSTKVDPNAVSLLKNIKRKEGLIRRHILGKRCHNMCRSTITGNPHLAIDEVGLPLAFARKVPIEEVVQEFNRVRLLEYVQNGRSRYPGCIGIKKMSTGKVHDPEMIKNIDLEVGDVVYRNIVDGDYVLFNRQPSLTLSNICAHRVRVMQNSNIKTLQMNVLACVLYAADFDGDQMNIIVLPNIAARNEIAQIASVERILISPNTSSPALGESNDAVIGIFELTRSTTRLSKENACFIFQNTTIKPDLSDIGPEGITGRDCVSKLFENIPINFTKSTNWYKEEYAKFIKYDPSDIKVVIKNGRLISGILDIASIGGGVNGSIFHVVCNEYGPKRALELLFNLQQIAISYSQFVETTMSLEDLLLSESAYKEVNSISADLVNKSNLISAQLNRDEIIPPIGQTVEQFYETQQLNALTITDEFIEPILTSIDAYNNNLFKMIGSGTKGKTAHLFNMVSSIGQRTINGERIKEKFAYKRTLPYYRTFETNPESRGYISASYLSGMNLTQYLMAAFEARNNLISKTMSTAEAGEQSRNSIKNLESNVTNNHRMVAKNGTVAVQFAYGDDYLDPRALENARFLTVKMTNSDFETKYKPKNNSGPHASRVWALMVEDREKYRRLFMNIEEYTERMMPDTKAVAISMERIVYDIKNADQFNSPDVKDTMTTEEKLFYVLELCEYLPYIMLNERQFKKRGYVPPMMQQATWLCAMLIRTYLNARTIEDENITSPVLMTIIDRVKVRYSSALVSPGTCVGIIAAQAFAEPLTQSMLSATNSSATGRNTSAVVMAREILGVKSTDKLQNPTMRIRVLPEYEGNKIKVQEIANLIEEMAFKQFVSRWQIFYEKYNEIVHPDYVHENDLLQSFTKLNPLLKVPSDLVRWCIRFELNKTVLILKNMSMNLLGAKIREAFPDTYVTYTGDNDRVCMIRVYMRVTMFKHVNLDEVRYYKNMIMNTIARGIKGINNTTVSNVIGSKINGDGSIAKIDDKWAITADGINTMGVYSAAQINPFKTIVNSVQEISELMGIEAARQLLIIRIRELVDKCAFRHFQTYADEMTYTGVLSSIDYFGVRQRDRTNTLLRLGYSNPRKGIEDACLNNVHTDVDGITGPIMLGTSPNVGTCYNSFVANEQFLRENVISAEKWLENI